MGIKKKSIIARIYEKTEKAPTKQIKADKKTADIKEGLKCEF